MTATTSETVITMPRLSDGMEDGTIVAWLVAEGEPVGVGADLVEIETDKATAVYQAPFGGVLRRLLQEGETAAVGAAIADLGGSGGQSQSRRKASPLARRRAAEAGIDLQTVAGSGPRGQIRRRDVEAHVPEAGGDHGTPAGVTATAPEPEPDDAITGRRVPLSRSQMVVVRRMAQAKSTIPDFQVSVEIDMEGCRELRSSLSELGRDGPVPSYNDMVIKACAGALHTHPKVNSSYGADAIELHDEVNVGMAVAADERLLVATVKQADVLSLHEIAAETRRLAARVRDETITPAELSGATFTVSNLGMLGVDDFTAVINPPQAAILAVGAVAPRAVVRDGELVARTTMRATLSADHRVLYGADGARFLATVKSLLEQPLALLLAS